MDITKVPGKKGDIDSLRFKNGKMHFSLNVFNAKQGEYYISYCPSLNISGYGKTKISRSKIAIRIVVIHP